MPNEASCEDIGCACMIEPQQLSSLAGTVDLSEFRKHLLSQYVSLCHLIIVLVIEASRGRAGLRSTCTQDAGSLLSSWTTSIPRG